MASSLSVTSLSSPEAASSAWNAPVLPQTQESPGGAQPEEGRSGSGNRRNTANSRSWVARDGTDRPLGSLGLERATLNRLARLGALGVRDLADLDAETLWRCVGRHGLMDLIKALTERGMPLPPLNDYERWRLGLVSRQAIEVRIDAQTPISDLWPRLGAKTSDTLLKRGFQQLRDAVPASRDDVRLLYRLGRHRLESLRQVFTEALGSSGPEDRNVLENGLKLIDRYGRSRSRDASSSAASCDHGKAAVAGLENAAPAREINDGANR